MSAVLANFLFEAVNFLLLAAGLGWLLFRPVKRALQAEQARHDGEREQAERMLAEAQMRLDQQGREQRALAETLSERRATAEATLRAQLDAMRAAARQDAERELRKWQAERAQAERAQLMQLSAAVGRMAARSVQRLLESLAGPALDAALLRAALSQLSQLPADGLGAITVESARPLSGADQRCLQQRLGDEVQLVERPELGAGVRVVTAAGQVDCTAAAIARQAALEVAAELSTKAQAAGRAPSAPAVETRDRLARAGGGADG